MQVAHTGQPPLIEIPSVLARTLDALGPFNSPPHLAVAVSGGVDSLALALLAHQWASARGGAITALTVDHGLRPASRAEAEQVARQMHARGITHHILTPPMAQPSNNLQEAARLRRYDALATWCRNHRIWHCLLAHHAGDQRETVAHHLARGKTADGAAGMAAARNYRGIRFLRPLLTTEKEQLIALLREQEMEWVEDPSNTQPRFARARNRAALAKDPAHAAELSTLAQQEGNARATRDNALAEAAIHCVTLHPAGYAALNRTAWMALPPTVGSQLLADILTTVSGATHRPRAADTQRLCILLQASGEAPTLLRRTLHGCEIRQQHGMIRIAREPARVAAPVTLCGQGSLRWDQRFTIHYALPDRVEMVLAALATRAKKYHPPGNWPRATPALWQGDRCLMLPHQHLPKGILPATSAITIGFTPAKPLAAAPFWWLNHKE